MKQVIYDMINEMSMRVGKIVPVEDIEKSLGESISKQELQEYIQTLEKEGKLERPRDDFVCIPV